MFACGPNFDSPAFIAIGAGAMTCLLSMVSGAICLFCSQTKLGIWLITVPIVLVGAALAVVFTFFWGP